MPSAPENNVFNPNVLDCIANLSSDEVFTPPKLANEALDLLPNELWQNPNVTFLDPACKSGVWLREIFKRLNRGLQDQIPDLQTRVDHILHKQLFGIAITELTSLLSRRSLYCSKYPNGKYSISHFDNVSGNIWFKNVKHIWNNGKCSLCGASESEYDRGDSLNNYAYGFLHLTPKFWEKEFGVKFDVIIGNPPYQLDTGGGGTNGRQARPIYQKFVEKAIALQPRYVVMITPSRWMTGGMGLDQFRASMLSNNHIASLTDYSLSTSCFPGVDIAGGVSYFCWDKLHSGKCRYTYIDGDKKQESSRALNQYNVFVRDSMALSIINKVEMVHEKSISTIMSSLGPFGLSSAERGDSNIDVSQCYKLLSSSGTSYIAKNKISTGQKFIDKWKVILGKATSAGAATASKDGKRKVLATVEVLPPQSVCTFSYFIGGSFDNKEQADNCKSYYCTKFARFLLLQCLSAINISKDKFVFVPLQDFTRKWTDKDLYEKYKLTDEEVNYIESTVKEMK